MFKLAALTSELVWGKDLGPDFSIPSVAAKHDLKTREQYDWRLRRHMIQHLTTQGCLPAKGSVKAMTYDDAVKHLSQGHSATGCFVIPEPGSNHVLSLELLFNSAVEQVANEFSALDAMCVAGGYVYTFDPPAIFAKTLGATLLNRLFIGAMAHVAALNHNAFKQMRCFGFNDYADTAAIPLLKTVLKSRPHISVVSKARLFPKPSGRYVPPHGAAGSLLVIHNNSDAFGQNIETEADGGSMDGAIGNHSSAAASLHRQHPGLVHQVLGAAVRMKTK
jgi:hypothetical protein